MNDSPWFIRYDVCAQDAYKDKRGEFVLVEDVLAGLKEAVNNPDVLLQLIKELDDEAEA